MVAIGVTTITEVVDLLFAAEEGGCLELALTLVGYHPEAAPHLVALQGMALDAGLTLDNQHWALSALELHKEVETLLGRDDDQTAAEVLDPDGEFGIDYRSLIAILAARIERQQGDVHRLRRLRTQLIQEQLARTEPPQGRPLKAPAGC